MRTPAEVNRALALVAAGHNYCAVSRLTGIPRTTIRTWAAGRTPDFGRRGADCMRCSKYRFPVPEITEFTYAYLLGLYLGDGTISTHPKGVYRLRVVLDRSYPGIVGECAAAMSLLVPGNRVTVIRRPNESVDELGSSTLSNLGKGGSPTVIRGGSSAASFSPMGPAS